MEIRDEMINCVFRIIRGGNFRGLFETLRSLLNYFERKGNVCISLFEK